MILCVFHSVSLCSYACHCDVSEFATSIWNAPSRTRKVGRHYRDAIKSDDMKQDNPLTWWVHQRHITYSLLGLFLQVYFSHMCSSRWSLWAGIATNIIYWLDMIPWLSTVEISAAVTRYQVHSIGFIWCCYNFHSIPVTITPSGSHLLIGHSQMGITIWTRSTHTSHPRN